MDQSADRPVVEVGGCDWREAASGDCISTIKRDRPPLLRGAARRRAIERLI